VIQAKTSCKQKDTKRKGEGEAKGGGIGGRGVTEEEQQLETSVGHVFKCKEVREVAFTAFSHYLKHIKSYQAINSMAAEHRSLKL